MDWQRPLNVEEALEEARQRWGEQGSISIADHFPRSRSLVGVLLPGPRFVVLGRGSSWEAAFADADARRYGASRRRSSTSAPLTGPRLFPR